MSMRGFFDLAYAGKAWVGGAVFLVTQIIAAVQLAVSDDAVSLAEAQGIWLLLTEAAGMVAGMWAVFQKRNATTPTG